MHQFEILYDNTVMSGYIQRLCTSDLMNYLQRKQFTKN